MTRRNTPIIAAYRVQFHAGFTFGQAGAMAEYLAALGVSHLYASPYLQSAPGSTHGYDVVDHRLVHADLGDVQEHRALCAALGQQGLGQLLDIVPNHMGVGPQNPWWWDMLRAGRCSPYAPYFDVDWNAPEPRLRDKLLLPVLNESFGQAVERGEIRLQRLTSAPDETADRRADNRPRPPLADSAAHVDFVIRYLDHVFPASAESMAEPLRRAAVRTRSETLAFLADACARLADTSPPRTRCRDARVLLLQIARLYDHPATARAIDDAIAAINRDPDALEAVLRRQHYRLAHWRTASREINYRRFFDINALIGLRVDDERVFHESHDLVLRWLGEGLVDALRIDHVDGLRDPQAYLERLRHAVPRDTWVVVEKVLQPGERLPQAWPVQGTTGYDFLHMLDGLFIDPAGEDTATEAYARLTGCYTDYSAVLRQAKAQVLGESFGGELNRLTALLLEICEHRRLYRDFSRHDPHEALNALVVATPVYRTYIRPDLGSVSAADKQVIARALQLASEHRPDVQSELLELLRDLLLLKLRGHAEDEFVLRFQQLTGPVMAKGAEDTAFYRYHRLVCLNEVGGDPSRFGVSPAEFYGYCDHLQRHWPMALLATSTHDTKRSEDVRARLALISEAPVLFSDAVARWMGLNAPRRADGRPDRNDEYLLYQTLVGAWPLDAQRAAAYMLKAVREARVHTTWTEPDEGYEQAVVRFTEGAMGDAEFIASLDAFVEPLVHLGRVNTLSQTAIKLTAPGVPDIFQGTELWSLQLVDPDNRAPVDFELRRKLLTALDTATAESAIEQIDTGLPKLLLMERVLSMRRRHAAAFGPESTFRPLPVTGAAAEHLVAFTRLEQVVTLGPRLVYGLSQRADGWGETRVELPPGTWLHAVTGERFNGGPLSVAQALRRFPVAVLERTAPPDA